jgi:hypothetical protein
MEDNRPKAQHWTFVKPSFDDNDIDRVQNLHRGYPSLIVYVAFAICDDDTGNRSIEGFVKTSRRCRSSTLHGMIGPALFKPVADLKGALRDIHSSRDVQEQGDASALRCSDAVIRNAKLLRELLDKDGLEQTLLAFPAACSEYPRLVRNHLIENYKPREIPAGTH